MFAKLQKLAKPLHTCSIISYSFRLVANHVAPRAVASRRISCIPSMMHFVADYFAEALQAFASLLKFLQHIYLMLFYMGSRCNTNTPVSEHIRCQTASNEELWEEWCQSRSAAAAYWTSWPRTSDHAHLDHAPSTSPWRQWGCVASKQERRTDSTLAERAPCPSTTGTTHSHCIRGCRVEAARHKCYYRLMRLSDVMYQFWLPKISPFSKNKDRQAYSQHIKTFDAPHKCLHKLH